MISQAIQQRLNDQINIEFYSAYLYLAMSSYASNISLNGAAKWLNLQAQEEVTHAMKIYDHLLERDGQVQLREIKQPPQSFTDIKEVFDKALAHERYVTSCINEIAGVALKENDFTTTIFLQWFLTEQIEEENNARNIVEGLKRVETGEGLLLIDRELGARESGNETAESKK